MNRLPVVLLLGGLGLRQRVDGDDLPKALRALPDGQPLILHVLRYYQSFGLDEFVLCVGYQADEIRKRLMSDLPVRPGSVVKTDSWVRFDTDVGRITLVDSGAQARKCTRLLDARPHLGDRRFLLGYGDVLSDLDLNDLVDLHEHAGGRMTMTVTRVRSRYGKVALGERSLVQSFEEKPIEQSYISAGYFVCEPALYDDLAADVSLESDVLPKLAARQQLYALRHEGMWVPLDTYKDFVEVESLMNEKGLAWTTPA